MKIFNNTNPFIAATTKGQQQNDQADNTQSHRYLLPDKLNRKIASTEFKSLLREYTVLNAHLIYEYYDVLPMSFYKEEQILRRYLFELLECRGLI